MAQAKKQYAALMEMGRLTKLINTIGSQKVRIERLSQIAAIECIGQSIVHRNVTPAIQLHDIMGKSLRRASLLQFFETHGNIAWDKTARKIVFRDNRRKFTEETVATLQKLPWFEAKKEEEPVSIFDMDAAFGRFFDVLKKKLGDKGLTIENRELFDTMHQNYLRWVVANGPSAKDEPQVEQPGEPEVKPSVNAEKLKELAEHYGKTPELKVAS